MGAVVEVGIRYHVRLGLLGKVLSHSATGSLCRCAYASVHVDRPIGWISLRGGWQEVEEEEEDSEEITGIQEEVALVWSQNPRSPRDAQ